MKKLFILLLTSISCLGAYYPAPTPPGQHVPGPWHIQSTNDAIAMVVQGQVVDTNYVNSWPTVRSFGAFGDGLHDDTAAFTNAINSMPNSGSALGPGNPSGILMVPPGVYNVTGNIGLPCGVGIMGSGRTAVIIHNTSTSNDTFYVISNTNAFSQPFFLRNLVISGSQSATAGAAIRIAFNGQPFANNALWPIVENVATIGHYYGLYLDTPVFANISNCHFHGAAYDGLFCTNRANLVTIQNSWFVLNKHNGATFSVFDTCSAINDSFQANGNVGFEAGFLVPFTTGSSIISCDTEANGAGALIHNAWQTTMIGYRTFANTNYDLRVEGSQGLTLIGYSMNDVSTNSKAAFQITNSPTIYGPPIGITLLGGNISTLSTNTLAIDHPESVQFGNFMQFNGFQGTVIGNKIVFDANTGSIGTGRTNTIGIPSFVARHDFSRLLLEAANTNALVTNSDGNILSKWWGGLQLAYDTSQPIKLIAPDNTTNSQTVLETIFVNSSPVVLWPVAANTYLGNGNKSVSLGFTDSGVMAALAVKGAVAVGLTNDPGPGHLILTNSATIPGIARLGTNNPDIWTSNGVVYISSGTNGGIINTKQIFP